MKTSNNSIGKKLEPILEYVRGKYEDGGKHKATVVFNQGRIWIDVIKDKNKLSSSFDVMSVGEFYRIHLKWIKEIPEQHTIFMAEILGQQEL